MSTQKQEIYKLIKEWFNTKTGVTLMHDPSLVSLVNGIEALRIYDVRQQRELLIAYEKTVGAMDINEVEKEVDKYLKDKSI